tara:strand:+ start:3046 stop:4419 length:1374 start_codon:yes stop_codon:yes gene_type:complete
MNFKIPWIINRRGTIIAIIIDYLLNIFLYNYIFFKEIEILPNKLVSISLAFFWITTSYVLGRYVKEVKITINSIFISFVKIILLFSLCNFIYLIINLGSPLILFPSDNQINNHLSIELIHLFFKSSLLISLFSFIIQYSFCCLTYRIYDKKKEWIFFGSKNNYLKILKEIKVTRSKIIISGIFNEEEFNLKKIESINGLIIENLNQINKTNLDIIFNLRLKGIVVDSIFTWFEKRYHRIPTHLIENKYEFFERIKYIEDNYQLRAKRIGDLFVSLFLLIITLPIIIIISFLIFIEDQGPLFYSQKRTGLNGKIIKIIKFRSMRIDAEKDGIQWSKKYDPRVTKIGRIIRATRLDELPQLISVVYGDMSLIGPRPERPEIEKNLLNNIPHYHYRNIIKPGISGWAQVNYPYGASKLDTTIKLSYDIYYIIHFSILLDFLILFKTIRLVFNAKGSNPNI